MAKEKLFNLNKHNVRTEEKVVYGTDFIYSYMSTFSQTLFHATGMGRHFEIEVHFYINV
jgi:hypothetical protein